MLKTTKCIQLLWKVGTHLEKSVVYKKLSLKMSAINAHKSVYDLDKSLVYHRKNRGNHLIL